MKKKVILISVMFLLISIVIGYGIYYRNIAKNQNNIENRMYQSFYNKEVLGTDIISVINKAIDSNERNSIEKDNNGNYIENDKNSIKIDIKFKELEKTVSMERINEIGMKNFWKNFSTFNFKCTKIENHSKTNNVKYLFFEQV